jgi:hypothetical protein
MDQAQINDIARVSVFALKSPISTLDWADLIKSAPAQPSSATLLQLLFDLPTITAVNGVLSANTLTEVFYLSVFNRTATPQELATIGSIAPNAAGDRALWLADLIAAFNAPDAATLDARAVYIKAVDQATTALKLTSHEVKLSAYTGALLNWSPDPALTKAAAQAIESGLSWSSVANILLQSSAGRATYASDLNTFTEQLTAQLLSRAPTATELSIIKSLGISDRGQLASVLIDFFQNYRGNIADYTDAATSLAQKTTVSALIQTSLPSLKVNADYGPADQGFAASQALMRGLSTPSVDRATASRFLSQVAEAPDLKSAALAVSGQGKAIDGYLAGSTVFVDLNGNGKLDTNEPKAETDSRGNYQLNGQVAPVIVVGGTDTASGKPFEGVLKAPAGSSVVTPLTTLVSNLQATGQSLAAATALVAKAVGLDQAGSSELLLNLDPIDALTTNKDPALAATALKIAAGAANVNNLVSMTSNLIQAAAGGSGRLSDADAANAVNTSLAKALAAQPSGAAKSIAFTSGTELASLLSTVTSEAAKTLPASVGNAVNQAAQSLSTAIAPVLASTAKLIESSTVQNTNAPALALTQVLQVQNAVQGNLSEKLSAAIQAGTLTSVASNLNAEVVQAEVVSAKVTAVNPSLANDQALIKDSGAQGTPPPTTTVSAIRISQDTGISTNDFITSQATQTITATLSEPLKAFERVQGSVDGGSTWTTLAASTVSGGTVSWPSVKLIGGAQAIAFRVIAGVETGPITRQSYTLSESKPTTSFSEVKLSADSGVLATDFLTSQVAQTLSATLSKALSVGERVFGSVDGGKTFFELAANVSGTNLRWSTSLAEGSQSIQFQVRDLAGNQGPTITQAYTLDTAAPNVAWSSLTLSADTGSSSTDLITKTAQQVISVRLATPLEANAQLFGSLDDGASYQDLTSQLSGQTLNWSTTLVGASNLRFQIRDAAGNVGSSQPQAYRLDTVPPSIVSIQPSWGDLLNSIEDDIAGTVTALLSGAELGQSAQLTINSKSYSGNVAAESAVGFSLPAADLQALSQGASYAITLIVTDAAGNSATSQATSFKVDRINPSIGAVSVSFGDRLSAQETSTPATVSFSTALLEDGRPISIVIQSTQPAAAPIFTTTATVSGNRVSATIPVSVLSSLSDAGTFNISASGSNAAGNPATSDSATRFSVDRTAPQIIAVSPSWGAYLSETEEKATNSQVAIQTSGLEDGQRVSLVINGQSVSGIVTNNSLAIALNLSTFKLVQGQAYAPIISAQDVAGNAVSVSDLGGFRVDRLMPSIVNVSPGWGLSLNAQEVLTDKTITVTTTQLEDGQAVSLRMSGKDYDKSFQANIKDNQATLSIPASELAKLLDNERYNIQVSASRVSGNVSPVKDDTAFIVDRTVPVIESVVLDWGNVLNAQESTQLRLITVKTIGVEAGLPISIKVGDQKFTASVQTTEFSTLSVPTSVWSQAQFPDASTQKVTVSVIDAAGNQSLDKEQSFTVDRRLPVISDFATSWGSSLNASEAASDQSVTAKVINAQPNSLATLTLQSSAAAPIVISASVQQSGTDTNVIFPIKASKLNDLADGSLVLKLNVKDKVTENESGLAQLGTTVDRFSPSIISTLTSWGDVLNDTEDNVNGEVNVTATGIEEGQIIKLTVRASDTKTYVYSATVAKSIKDSVEIFSAKVLIPAIDLQALVDAKRYSIDVELSDAAGNVASKLVATSFVVDRQRPIIESIVSDWGPVLDGTESLTQRSVLIKTKNVEDGQTVGITLKGKVYEALVSNNKAQWLVPIDLFDPTKSTSLNDGNHILLVNVNNLAGNAAQTGKLTFMVDRVGPFPGTHRGELPEIVYQDNTIIFRLNEPLSLGNPPLPSAFSLLGQKLDVVSVALFEDYRGTYDASGPYSSVKLTLKSGQVVDPFMPLVINYKDPSPNNDSNALQDIVGNDALDFTVNNQPSNIQVSLSMTRAGVKAIYSVPFNTQIDPIAAYDIYIPANGQRGVLSVTAPLTFVSNTDALLGVAPSTQSDWRVVGITSALGNSSFVIGSGANIFASVIYDRVQADTVRLPIGFIGYDQDANIQIGGRVTSVDTLGNFKLVESATVDAKFKKTSPSDVIVPGTYMVGTAGNDKFQGTDLADIYLSLTGDDEIKAGPGADGIILGAGKKTVIHNAFDSGDIIGLLDVSKKSDISVLEFDIYSGLGMKGEGNGILPDIIDFPDGDYSTLASFEANKYAGISGNQITASNFDHKYSLLRGAYNPFTERFEISASGQSSMLLVGIEKRIEAIVLVGFTGAVFDDGSLGVFTLAPPGG